MGLLNRIRDALGWRPALRNKPGGMAWIRRIDQSAGAEQLNGRAVRCVRIDPECGLWQVDPPQHFVCTQTCLFGASQRLIREEQIVWVEFFADDLLEPWKAAGADARDESAAWLPPVPGRSKESAHA